MAKYRKLPVVIDAVQFDPHSQPWPDGVIPWVANKPRDMSWGYIQTLEGKMHVIAGDWIITGVKGEKYPCKDDIFKATYEPVENERTAAIDEVDNHAQPASDNALREALAEYAHTAWSGWMRYMFNNCGGEVDSKLLSTGAAIIPQWAVERWQRQMNTPYANLPESEKESDRADADKMLEILSQFKPIEEQP